MRHENSVFHQLTKHVPWNLFDQLVDKHKSDFRVRRLDSKSQFLALLFGQLSGAKSLREIEAGLKSHQARLYHVGAKCAARSTLADANAKRPWALFGDLFAQMVANANRSTRRKMGDATRILDATTISLSNLSIDWARCRNNTSAIKVHVVYDPDNAIPCKAVITPENVNDITPAKDLKLEAGSTYVFDLGYYSYAWWAKLDASNCRFVTRLKRNTPIIEIKRLAVQSGSDILSDMIGYLPKRQSRSRKNPMAKPVREITVRISTGKIIRLVTNDLKAPSREIADLYKQRWQIELFFKWIKQNLKIKHFLGVSQNAVRIQLFVALIAYLLLRRAHENQKTVKQHITFMVLIRLNIMHIRPINTLNKPPTKPPQNTNQITMDWV